MSLFRRIDLLVPPSVSEPEALNPLLEFLAGLASRQGAQLRLLQAASVATAETPAASAATPDRKPLTAIAWDAPDVLLHPPNLLVCDRDSLLRGAELLRLWQSAGDLPAVLVLERLTPTDTMQVSGLLVLDDRGATGEDALWIGVTLAQQFQSRLLITGLAGDEHASSPGGATPIGATAESYPFWERLSHLDWRTIAGGVRVSPLAELTPATLAELISAEQLTLSILPTGALDEFAAVPGMLLLLPRRSSPEAH
jgi:hypothetical protein